MRLMSTKHGSCVHDILSVFRVLRDVNVSHVAVLRVSAVKSHLADINSQWLADQSMHSSSRPMTYS